MADNKWPFSQTSVRIVWGPGMFSQYLPRRERLVARTLVLGLEGLTPFPVLLQLSVSHEGLWKSSQGQVLTWNTGMNMGCPPQNVMASDTPSWAVLRLPRHYFECWQSIQLSKGKSPCLKSNTKSWSRAQNNSHDRVSTYVWVTYHKPGPCASPVVSFIALCCYPTLRKVYEIVIWKYLDSYERFLAYHWLTKNLGLLNRILPVLLGEILSTEPMVRS